MKKFVINSLLFLFAGAAWGQNYIKRTTEEPVYDVEVIVFGHNLTQPSADSIQQATVFDQQKTVDISFIPADEDWPTIKMPPDKQAGESAQSPNNPEISQEASQEAAQKSTWQVPLNEQPVIYEVLVWYLKSRQLIGSVVNLLDNNPKYKPLIRQLWRQPTTPFNKPLYVKVNSAQSTPLTDPATSENTTQAWPNSKDFLAQPIEIQDFQVAGQVALSQGRFIHLHTKFNYYRINQNQEVLIYGSKQQRQIKLDQWQYFDHPQFGVLVKVTPVKAEELL